MVVQTGEAEMSIYCQPGYAQALLNHTWPVFIELDGFAFPFSRHMKVEKWLPSHLPLPAKKLSSIIHLCEGEIKIRIVGMGDGISCRGYPWKEVQSVIGNEIFQEVFWNGSSDVSDLSGSGQNAGLLKGC